MGATSFGATGRRADHFNLTVPTGWGGGGGVRHLLCFNTHYSFFNLVTTIMIHWAYLANKC